MKKNDVLTKLGYGILGLLIIWGIGLGLYYSGHEVMAISGKLFNWDSGLAFYSSQKGLVGHSLLLIIEVIIVVFIGVFGYRLMRWILIDQKNKKQQAYRRRNYR